MDRQTAVVAAAAAVGVAAAAFAAGYAASKAAAGGGGAPAARPHSTFDLLDKMLGAELHVSDMPHRVHHHSALGGGSRLDGAAEGEGAGGAGAGSTPARKKAAPRFPDSAYPTGSAVVAHQELLDPAGAGAARRKLSSDRRGPVIVGVAGASGSGKTSIATLIAERLAGIRVAPVSCDSYYKSLGPGVDASEYNFDHPSSIDFDLLAEHLRALRAGGDVAVPAYDFVTHRRTDATTLVSGRTTDVVILDGIFVLHAEGVRTQCDVTIFTAEDLDICLARRLKRDLVERGRTVESVLAQYVRFVRAGFHQFVAPTMTSADFIVPRARENETAIAMLARDIERRVNAE
jgi:uridine kinase